MATQNTVRHWATDREHSTYWAVNTEYEHGLPWGHWPWTQHTVSEHTGPGPLQRCTHMAWSLPWSQVHTEHGLPCTYWATEQHTVRYTVRTLGHWPWTQNMAYREHTGPPWTYWPTHTQLTVSHWPWTQVHYCQNMAYREHRIRFDRARSEPLTAYGQVHWPRTQNMAYREPLTVNTYGHAGARLNFTLIHMLCLYCCIICKIDTEVQGSRFSFSKKVIQLCTHKKCADIARWPAISNGLLAA